MYEGEKGFPGSIDGTIESFGVSISNKGMEIGGILLS